MNGGYAVGAEPASAGARYARVKTHAYPLYGNAR
ncbi:hypothetical protein MICRO8M_50045 [Microbacterium sp. 8M]|nr:hypothetical protein MICRO8M_50045 [Microbacterium sp. 8M]